MAARKDNPDKPLESGQLEADIEQLKADLARLNETLMALGRDSVDAVQSESAAQLNQLRNDIDGLAQSLKSRGQSQLDALEAQVRDKPFVALLAAFGVGVLLSRLFERR